jgi:hypothetical protein
MAAALKVLILGGYGTFGGRLAQLLADEPRLNLLIAGRSRAKAEEFCRALGGKVEASPWVFDREGDVEQQLADAAPDIVVDASGPFQAYGDAYRVIRACVERGVHYLDLADGSDFVKGVATFDAEAKARNVFVLSGVSSFPVLTAAVVRKLSDGLTRIDTLSGGIAPSPYAGVGLNVIRAIASYAGQPIELIDGRHHALTETRRYTIAAPGRLPLHPILFSLVDVPDLKVLPDLWPSLRSVWMGAGPVPEILHRALIVLAWLVRLRLLPTLYPFAPMMFQVINVLRWGEHRGGMFVEIEGLDAQGKLVTRSWHMVAEKNDGPFIPSMAAEAIIRNALDGRPPTPGARPATHELELSDYDALFARRQIHAGFRLPMPDGTPLYQRVLGEAWHALPKPLQDLHDLKDTLAAEGRAAIERNGNFAARLIANLFGFPNAGEDVPVKVSFRLKDGREIWRREFAGRVMQSTQEEGQGRFERLICERFGPFAFGLALVLRGGRLLIVVRRWTMFGIPMPLALAPSGDAYESTDDGRFNFHVEIGLPLIGMIVRYRGWLVPRATPPSRP